MQNQTEQFTDVSPETPVSSPSPSVSRVHRPLPRLWWGIVIGLAIAAVVFFSCFKTDLVMAIIASLFAFTFGASLTLEDSAVRVVLVWMATRSIAFPSLIWEFSLDGFLWLIAMKLLFAVIGFVAGVLFALLGVVISALISPISYPIELIAYLRDA